jgi:copper chaperone CopZ
MEGRKPARTTLIAASVIVTLFIGLNLYTYAGQRLKGEQAPGAEPSGKAQIILPVEGMTCFACEITVEKALASLEGVEKADAKVTQKSVTVVYDPQKVSVEELIAAVNRTGYRAHAPERVN